MVGIKLYKRLKKARSWKIWQYLKNYKFNSILLRNFAIIIILVVLPSCTLSFIYSHNTKSILREEVSSENMNTLYRSSDMLESTLNQMKRFCYNLSVEQDTRLFIFSNKNEMVESGLGERIIEKITMYKLMYDYIDSIYLYSEQTGLVVYQGEIVSLNEVPDKSWAYAYIGMKDGEYQIQSRRKNEKYPYLLSLICPINNGYSTNIGAVVVNIDVEKLGALINSNGRITQELLILAASGALYYSSDRSMLDHPDEAMRALSFLKESRGDFSEIRKIGDQEWIVSCVTSRLQPWKYVLLSPISYYEGKFDSLAAFMVETAAIVVVLGLIVSYLITLRSFQPVSSIMAVIGQNPVGKSYVSGENYRNEIQYITSMVRHTQEKNSTLQMELDERMEKLNNSQLLALQSQIDPHFLYNTLDTISWMAIDDMGGENRVSEMISALAQLLRIGLERSNYLVPVEKEVEHAKQYVKILELRYTDKLKVYWDISPDILECMMVRLSIQPLVENSISHGLRAKRYEGTIRISGRLIEDMVVISVEDNGVGMTEEKIQELNQELRREYNLDSDHIGVRNVNQRMKLLFGEKSGIIVSARENGGGVAVTMIFPRQPLRTMEQHENHQNS